jgi:hypothetical protein
MHIAEAESGLGVIAAREGDLGEAVTYGHRHCQRPEADTVTHYGD